MGQNTDSMDTSCKLTFLPFEEEKEPTLVMASFVFLSTPQ